jgi:hypothetical protein
MKTNLKLKQMKEIFKVRISDQTTTRITNGDECFTTTLNRHVAIKQAIDLAKEYNIILTSYDIEQLKSTGQTTGLEINFIIEKVELNELPIEVQEWVLEYSKR